MNARQRMKQRHAEILGKGGGHHGGHHGGGHHGGHGRGFGGGLWPYYYGDGYYYDDDDYDDDDLILIEKKKVPVHVVGAPINSPQDYSSLQYSIPFQTDDAYADWSPTRPQAYYADPRYPSLPTTGGPLFNTRMRDPDEMDWEDRFDGLTGSRRLKHR